MATTSNTTLKKTILQLAKRRKNGVTAREAFNYISERFANDDGSDIRAASVRARTYELENDGLIEVQSLSDGSLMRRNGSMVFKATDTTTF